MSKFPFRALIAVALSVLIYSLTQKEWAIVVLMGAVALSLVILLLLASKTSHGDTGDTAGTVSGLILGIGKAVPPYLFLFIFVGLGFALYHRNWIISLVLAVAAALLVGTEVFAHILPEWNSSPRLIDESFFLIGFVFLLGVLYKYIPNRELFLWLAGSLVLMALPVFIALRKVFHPKAEETFKQKHKDDDITA